MLRAITSVEMLWPNVLRIRVGGGEQWFVKVRPQLHLRLVLFRNRHKTLRMASSFFNFPMRSTNSMTSFQKVCHTLILQTFAGIF